MTETGYLARTHREPPSLLLELEQHGRSADAAIIERETGRLLSTLVHAMQANRILEIGTGFGYATLWMALALPPAGKIWTIDPDRESSDVARTYFERAEVDEAIEILSQPALDIIPSISVRNLDIIFIDGRKDEFPEYLELCVPLLKRSGLLIVDDIMHTMVDRNFHREFVRHPELDATILPLGDGLGIGARIGMSDAAPLSDAASFKDAMRCFPTGVTVVTTWLDGKAHGFTANAFCSVSADPPSVLICVNRNARSHALISAAGRFCVNVLQANQRTLAEHFSSSGDDTQFANIAFSREEQGSPRLDDSLAWLDCTVAEEHTVATHTIFIGNVLHAASYAEGRPLGYFQGRFHDLTIS